VKGQGRSTAKKQKHRFVYIALNFQPPVPKLPDAVKWGMFLFVGGARASVLRSFTLAVRQEKRVKE
jgi:hypothetical protein